MKKKIIVISDSHGEISNFIWPYIKSSDYIFHAGDICSTDIIFDLKKACKNVYLVAGNNDIPEKYVSIEDKKIISKLNTNLNVNIDGKIISLEHGHRFGHKADHEGLRNSYPNSKLIIYGHTHYQVCDKTKEPWVINPGACGHTRNNDGGPCFVQIEIDGNEWSIIPYCFN